MKKQSIFLALGLILPLLAGGGGAAVAAEESLRSAISVESDDDATRLWVDVVLPDGSSHRRLLRETSASVHPQATGWDPDGKAGFATWDESGARWFSYSRDMGRNWSEARPLQLDLRLRDGEIAPDDRMPDAPGHLMLSPGGALYLVQLKTISLPEWRAALEKAGAEVLAYLPNNAHVVRLGDAPDAQVEALAGLEIVERVEPYHPWYRLSAELRTWLEEPGDAAPERMRVRVAAFDRDAETKERIVAAAGDSGAEVVDSAPRGLVVELNVNRDQLAWIAALDDVQWIDPWAAAENDMDLMREDSGADWLESNYFSVEDSLGFCGQGVRGEVMDSGTWEAHPDFDPISFHGPHDTAWHGTCTYGIVFGRGYGDPRARGLLPCGEGIFADSNELTDRYAHTAELKQSPYFASFQTNSWGNGRTTDYSTYSEELDEIIWKLDIAILQSQSNEGVRYSRPQAWAKNVISVGGIKHQDTLDAGDDLWCEYDCSGYASEAECVQQPGCSWRSTDGWGSDPHCRASCASVGPAADGRVKPDVHYWYDGIYTTDLEPGGYTPDSVYTSFGGTSAATPEVAGVLGLMLQMWKENVWGTDHLPETTVFEAQPHFSTLKALLINNAQQYSFSGEEHDLSRHKQGWGRPSVRVAAERAANSFIVDQDLLLEVGELATYRIDVAPGESDLKVTMVYPDPPGNPASSLARVNDLDLRVISPSGEVYHGNVGLTAGNASVPGGTANRIDTVENVFVVDPEPGIWSVAIEAAEINEDACPVGHESTCGPTPGGTPEADATFSLVVTGGVGAPSCTVPTADFTVTPNPAMVGEEVQFQTNVSGGAGGPYSYWWDFEGDGAADSTEENPLHVYTRPFDGPVKLWVADAVNCPVTVQKTVTVTGPDLWYDSYSGLTEVVGNGNGGIDPGETWELTVNLRNDGDESAEDVGADLSVDPASPVSVTLQQGSSDYADIGVGGTAPSILAYRFQVDGFAPCGEWISLNLTATARPTTSDQTNTYPTEVGVIRLWVGGTGPAVTFFFDDFETDNGWRIGPGNEEGEWQRDAPQALGGTSPDPGSAYEGQRVLGNDLTGLGEFPGEYENNVWSVIQSPPIDITGLNGVELRFARWLNVSPGDDAFVGIWADGNWSRVWTGPQLPESSWTLEPIDISDSVTGAQTLEVGFYITSDGQGTNSGWNIDAFEVRGVPVDSCEPYAPAVQYDSYSGLTEIEGNGNSLVDPGETWEMYVHLRNHGVFPAGDVSADLTVDPATPGSVFLLQDNSEYGTIDPGQVVPSLRAYRFRVGDVFPCGGEVVLSATDITSTDPPGSYPDEVGVIRLLVGATGAKVQVFFEDFESPEEGWESANPGEWQIDVPQGLGGPVPDPDDGFQGPMVLGTDLTGLGLEPGNYEIDSTSFYLSPRLDVSRYVQLDVSYARYLNVGAGDTASFRIWTPDDSAWTTLYSSSDAADQSWTSVPPIDISDIADGRNRIRFMFHMESDGQDTASGWNIDAFDVRGISIESCAPFERALPGEATHLLVGKGPPGLLELQWSGDCGAATTYGIYRGDLRVGYDSIVAEAGQCDVAATNATIPEGSGDAEFFLVVPHKDGEEGSYGTDSSGTPRPPAAGGCYPQGEVNVCEP